MDGSVHGARSTHWSVTINLKNVSHSTAEECIARARQRDWRVFGQLEQGDSGTEHYQLAVATPQVRFAAVKKVFPTAHIEIAKDWNALLAYCTKEETRVDTLKNVSTGYISWSQLRNMFFDHVREVQVEHVTDPEERSREWDIFVGLCIQRRFEVDVMGVNPQYRACIQKYWVSYLHRQTDRQTEQTVVVPTIYKQDVEETESVSSEGSEGSEGSSSSWPSDASPF